MDPVTVAVARLLAAKADLWRPVADIGECSPNDWVRLPVTDSRVQRWEAFMPLAAEVLELLRTDA